MVTRRYEKPKKKSVVCWEGEGGLKEGGGFALKNYSTGEKKNKSKQVVTGQPRSLPKDTILF